MHRYVDFTCLENGHSFVVVDIDTCHRVDGDDLVIDPEPGFVRRPPRRHPGDEDPLVVPLEGGGAKAPRDTQAKALVRSGGRAGQDSGGLLSKIIVMGKIHYGIG